MGKLKMNKAAVLFVTLTMGSMAWGANNSKGFCVAKGDPLEIKYAIVKIEEDLIIDAGYLHQGSDHNFFQHLSIMSPNPVGKQTLTARDWGGDFTLTRTSYGVPVQRWPGYYIKADYHISSDLHYLKIKPQDVHCIKNDLTK